MNKFDKSGLKPEIEVFDRMAPGWYSFRHHTIFRQELEELARGWAPGSLLNVGCGHGPDFLAFREKFELTGLDISSEMIRLARKYARKYNFNARLLVSDARRLPFAGDAFDYAIAVATYHHLKGRTDQLAALCELKRVLKPGGQAFVTVWNHGQPRFWFKKSEVGMPWKSAGQVIQRYYYLFHYWEFEKLVKEAGFRILKSAPESRYSFPLKYFSRNICLTIQKDQ